MATQLMVVEWQKCQGECWCDLKQLNLSHPHFNNMVGVYIIWSGSTVVRVGQGVIADRLAAHRQDPAVVYAGFDDLKVTWARVDGVHRDGVETYLGELLKPRVGDRFPMVVPIPVNLPWS